MRGKGRVRREGGSGDVQLASDAELLDAFPEGGTGDAQHLGSLHLIAGGFLERLDDELSLLFTFVLMMN
jgi:hypothetical protein